MKLCCVLFPSESYFMFLPVFSKIDVFQSHISCSFWNISRIDMHVRTTIITQNFLATNEHLEENSFRFAIVLRLLS